MLVVPYLFCVVSCLTLPVLVTRCFKELESINVSLSLSVSEWINNLVAASGVLSIWFKLPTPHSNALVARFTTSPWPAPTHEFGVSVNSKNVSVRL